MILHSYNKNEKEKEQKILSEVQYMNNRSLKKETRESGGGGK